MELFQSDMAWPCVVDITVGQILSRNSLYNILDGIEKNVCFDSFML